MPPKRALRWVLTWVVTATLFAAGVFRFSGTEAGIEFITCYAIEWTLSLDNLFVFLMIFNSFGVTGRAQLRALEWGIIGAIIMRLGFILIGVTLVTAFKPILYFFGALLIYSAFRMAISGGGENKDVRNSPIILWIRHRFPITKNYYGDKFFIRRGGKRLMATPMVLVLITIESSDIMFAIDSIPAAFAITQRPFIIFTANLFAILGLRSLYFLLAHADKIFSKLKYGIIVILAFVGVKIILEQLHFHISLYLSLGIVVVCLGGSILWSVFLGKRES